MDTKINNFLQKKGINSSDIMYFTREGQKTSIHISNSQVSKIMVSWKNLNSF